MCPASNTTARTRGWTMTAECTAPLPPPPTSVHRRALDVRSQDHGTSEFESSSDRGLCEVRERLDLEAEPADPCVLAEHHAGSVRPSSRASVVLPAPALPQM